MNLEHGLCYYNLVTDSYEGHCSIGCTYCYSSKGTQSFQSPEIPTTDLLSALSDTFESNIVSFWSKILIKKIPIRIGFETDPFQQSELTQKKTLRIIKILNQYDYPYIIFTKSEFITHNDYFSILRNDLAQVQISVSSPFIEHYSKIEPYAPSFKLRVQVAKKLSHHGISTILRANILPQALVGSMNYTDYLTHFFDELKESKLKVIINEIVNDGKESADSNEKIKVMIKNHLESIPQLSHCYLGSSPHRFYEFKSICNHKNCCQYNLQNQLTTKDLSDIKIAAHMDEKVFSFYKLLTKNLLNFLYKNLFK